YAATARPARDGLQPSKRRGPVRVTAQSPTCMEPGAVRHRREISVSCTSTGSAAMPPSAQIADLSPPGAALTAQRRFQIAAIPADGVGVEVVTAGRTVLDALAAESRGAFAFDWTEFPWGCGYYERTGQ